jgi:hypothetical protein
MTTITAMGLHSFKTIDRFPIPGRGVSYLVALPDGFRCKSDEIQHVLERCILDDRLVRPVGFELHCTIHQSAGMRIGIILPE